MAFRTAQNAAEAFTLAKNLARGVKQTAQSNAAAFASTTNRDQVLALAVNLREWRIGLAAARDVPGVGQYARDQYADQTYDVAAEFTAMLAAIDAVITEIHASFPVDNTGGEVKERVLNADGSITMRTFTAAQLATLVTRLQTLDAAVTF
jgi:hypothetical protein